MFTRKYQKGKDNSIYVSASGERIDLRKLKKEGGKVVLSKGESSNKYGAHSASFMGVSYHSTAEANYAQELELRKRAGEIKDWKRQVKIPLDVNGFHIANYFIDFLVTHKDDSEEYIEVKGMETPEWQLKWKLTEAIFSKEKPYAVLTVVKVGRSSSFYAGAKNRLVQRRPR